MKKYLVGTSGWNYEDWQGKFYPNNIKKKDWFQFYAKNFNTVEINYSFYRWPKPSTIKKWHKESPKNFKYTLKAPRTITHMKKLKNTEKQVKDFYKLTNLLKNKKGCHLFQLPPFYKPTQHNKNKLKKFLQTLDARKDNCLEFRHPGWWNQETYDLFKKHHITFCIVSGLNMPKNIVQTDDIVYFRFHGQDYATKYTKKQIKNYAQKMKKLKCKKVYAYFNNDINAHAVKNSMQLKSIIRAGKP